MLSGGWEGGTYRLDLLNKSVNRGEEEASVIASDFFHTVSIVLFVGSRSVSYERVCYILLMCQR